MTLQPSPEEANRIVEDLKRHLAEPSIPCAHNWPARYKCLNKDCRRYDQRRDISLPHLGDGAYLAPGNVLCGNCGHAMLQVALVDLDQVRSRVEQSPDPS